jgi:hypothetical protein
MEQLITRNDNKMSSYVELHILYVCTYVHIVTIK